MAKVSTEGRLRRILAMVPWVAAHDGPSVTEVCRRFECRPHELAADIGLLYLCGLHPYTPDLLIEAEIRDARVWVHYADYFSRPLRLTPAEGLGLVAAAQTLLAVPGTDPLGPLARGLSKLATSIGAPSSVAVELGDAEPQVLSGLRAAADAGEQVEIDYLSFARNQRSWRTIEPAGVFTTAGQWYVSAWCHLADDERVFRVDRIAELRATGLARTQPAVAAAPALFERPGAAGEATLRLKRGAEWVAEQYPVLERIEETDGTMVVRMGVTEFAWLDRLVVRLGTTADVLSAPVGWNGAAAAAASILTKYAATDGG